jgi:Ca-activated chloride channel family protein
MLSDFHFIRPAWLLLLPIVVTVWWLGRHWQDPLRGWRAVMDRDLLGFMTVGEDGSSRWRGVTLLVGWVIAVVAVAGPTWRPEPSPFADDPVPVMVLLRADESMDLTDLVPSRMERARLKAGDFANGRKGQPVGLIAYAGTSHLVLPPTRDTLVVASMAAEISPQIMPRPGDDLAGALKLAAETLGDAGGSILVIADTANELNAAAMAEFRSIYRMPVYFLAVTRPDTPELDLISQAAASVKGDVIVMTPDDGDVQSLVKQTATAPVAVAAAGQGTRWAEAGWWLVPLLALLSLSTFRRVGNTESEEAT